MITCPECGELAPDNAKFCERCGQGLGRTAAPAPSPSKPAPLAVGAWLKGGFEIVEVLAGTSIENRYRAHRRRDGETASYIVRERFGEKRDDPAEEADPSPATVAQEDPNGPRAKTAELKPVAADVEPGLEAATAEGLQTESAPAPAESDSAPPAASNGAVADQQIETAEGQSPDEAVADSATETAPAEAPDDLGEVFGRVLALSFTLTHPAFQRAIEGLAEDGRVYLVYADEDLAPVSRGSAKMNESDAIAAAIQICQAIAFVHR